MPNSISRSIILAAFVVLVSGQSFADEIRVAVASNFAATMAAVVDRFESSSNHTVTLVTGSTGKHYAQIRHGAPFDIFFAADAHRPELLEAGGLAVPGSRFTYAVGKLVLWSPVSEYIDSQASVLAQGQFRHIAIANPRLAPYGRAAREVLQARGLWGTFGKRLVRGENIGQAFQFVKSGNAELGFVAYSQFKHFNQAIQGSWWEIPQQLYTPIEQQAVLLNDTEAARAFLLFIRSNEALKVIHDCGYDTP